MARGLQQERCPLPRRQLGEVTGHPGGPISFRDLLVHPGRHGIAGGASPVPGFSLPATVAVDREPGGYRAQPAGHPVLVEPFPVLRGSQQRLLNRVFRVHAIRGPGSGEPHQPLSMRQKIGPVRRTVPCWIRGQAAPPIQQLGNVASSDSSQR